MTTKYQCKGCVLIFEGIDPFPFGQGGEMLYPLCPNSLEVGIDTSQGLEEAARILDQLGDAHEVSLAVIAQTSIWGSFKIKADTKEEKLQREQQSKLNALALKNKQIEAELNSDALRLVQRMEREITQKKGTVSSNFPKDWQYGMKSSGNQITANAAVIHRASTIWLLKGNDYKYRAPQFKQVWGVKMANFEKLIISGDEKEGKHNFHVIPC